MATTADLRSLKSRATALQGRIPLSRVGLSDYSWAGWTVERVTTASGAEWAIVTTDPTESVGVLLGRSTAGALTALDRMAAEAAAR
jgi:hypothetical protein